MPTVSLFRRAGAECVGAYALVTAGCGAIVVNAGTGALTHLGIALTFGLIITVMIASVGKPKDGDPRACYVSLTAEGTSLSVEFIRSSGGAPHTLTGVTVLHGLRGVV